jgi:hypothetical protein
MCYALKAMPAHQTHPQKYFNSQKDFYINFACPLFNAIFDRLGKSKWLKEREREAV